MARTDVEVVEKLLEIYDAEFGGKRNQRYLISWTDLRGIYGFGKLHNSRFGTLVEAGTRRFLYLFDLGEGESGRLVAVVRSRTIDRWRRVPKKIIDQHRIQPEDDAGEDEGE